jgi:ornithine cyclodeaminase/alanine dehydrogenase-like protein (mu-crystallin family)
MPDPTMWIGEADVASVLDLPGAIAVLADGFAAEAAGGAVPMDKTMATFAAPGSGGQSSGGHGTLHALGAAAGSLAGAKVWAHTPGGADPLLVLFDSATGRIVAAVEAFALGQLRTAATAGLATDRLARPDAGTLAIIGTGKQALPQVAAVAAVRPISQVRAFSPTAGRREDFAARVREQLGLPCTAAASAAEAVDGADVVTLVTRATEPVLTAAMVRPGMHVNAVGAIDLARREFEPAILRRASVVTDSPGQARRLSAELREFFGAGSVSARGDDPPIPPRDGAADDGWHQVRSLGDVVRDGPGRPDPGQITVFKGMGSGIADVAIGAAVLARVTEAGRGTPVPRLGRAAPALTAAISAPTAKGIQ